VQATYFGCNPSDCAGAHDPGEAGWGIPVDSNKHLEGLTALLLLNEMFPPAVIDHGPGRTGAATIVLRK
jgi:hypothetical protein